jgi:hypothetical protein
MSEGLPSKSSHSRDHHDQPVSVGRYPARDDLPVAAALTGGLPILGIAGYAGSFGILWATFGGDSATVFALTIITQLGLMYFGFAFLLMNRTVARRGAGAEEIQSRSRDFDMLAGRISGWSVFA